MSQEGLHPLEESKGVGLPPKIKNHFHFKIEKDKNSINIDSLQNAFAKDNKIVKIDLAQS